MKMESPIIELKKIDYKEDSVFYPISCNNFYIKREDMIPYCFGGNKFRIVNRYFEEIDKGHYDAVVTYGGSDSNLCRIISNNAAERGIRCIVVSPKEIRHQTFNQMVSELFGAEYQVCQVKDVSATIDLAISDLKKEGYRPYFIPGGGHGLLGTEACIEIYKEIILYEKAQDIRFDYVFFASGTGTTQSGMVVGKIMEKDKRPFIGISIARENPRGRQIVLDAIKEYFEHLEENIDEKIIEEQTIFTDKYIGKGYGGKNVNITGIITHMMKYYGIPLDSTYTGKAFWGMLDYLKKEKVRSSNILFIHTGGTPLYFDWLVKKAGRI